MSRNTVFGLDQPCWTVIFWRKNFTFSVNIPSIQFPITFLHHIHFLKKCYINFFPSTSQKIQPNSIWKHYLFSWKRISESTKSSMSPKQEWISRDWVLCIGLTIRMKIEGTNYVLKTWVFIYCNDRRMVLHIRRMALNDSNQIFQENLLNTSNFSFFFYYFPCPLIQIYSLSSFFI